MTDFDTMTDAGLQALERFERTGQPDELDLATRQLRAAANADPTIRWPHRHHGLAIALGYQADLHSDRVVDRVTAAGLLVRVLGAARSEPGYAAEVMTDICSLIWSGPADPADPVGEVAVLDRVLVDLGALLAESDGSRVDELSVAPQGLAYLHRHRITGAESDLRDGIRALQRALPRLPSDLAVSAELWSELSEGYGLRFEYDEDEASLDGVVTAAVRARELMDPGDTAGWLNCLEGEALARQFRWDNTRHRQRWDLDRAIECFTAVLDSKEDVEAYLYYGHGSLLLQRASEDRSRQDAARALPSLQQAADGLPEDSDLRALCHFSIGAVYELQRDIDPDSADLVAEAAAFAAAAQTGLADPAAEVIALAAWFELSRKRVVDEVDADSALLDAEAALAAADRAADRIHAADPVAGKELARLLIEGRVWQAGDDLQRMASDRFVELFGRADLLSEFQGIGGSELGRPLLQAMKELPQGAGTEMNPASEGYLLVMAAMGSVLRSLMTGDLTLLATGREQLTLARDRMIGHDLIEVDLALAAIDLMRRGYQPGSPEPVMPLIARAVELSDALTEVGRPNAWATLIAAYADRQGVPGPAAPVVSNGPQPLHQLGTPGKTVEDGLRLGQLFHRLSVRMEQGSNAEIRSELENIAALSEGMGPEEYVFSLYAGLLGLGWLELAQRGDHAGLSAAVDWNESALRAMSGPQHPLWSMVTSNLAVALRMTNHDRQRCRSLGRECLRGFAWQALLQSGTGEAVQVAHRVGDFARMLMDWCIEDGAWSELVGALEAGRGLVLHAATTTRGVSDQLRAMGATRLAEEWERAGGAAIIAMPTDLPLLAMVPTPTDLRYRVLLRLWEGGAGRLLEAPSVEELQVTIASQSLSALVYLVPGAANRLGFAVVVAPDRPIELIALPGLRSGPGTVLADYEQALTAARSARYATDPAHQVWTDTLHSLCDWAWDVAGRELWRLCDSWWPNRTPRLVIVAAGALALVPWHASRRPVGRGYRYLAQDVELSILPSGRMLCDVVARTPPSHRSTTVVSNPTGDLTFAGEEAAAVHSCFYPDGVLLGLVRTDEGVLWAARDGAGTPEEVLRAIGGGAASGDLHIACHAVPNQDHPERSKLLLAGRAELPVADIVRHESVGPLELDRVYLSACATNLSGLDYDEAFSLASAFLAAGARTVFGSLWQVADGQTSTLMFMIHHYLAGGHRPAEALHLAQRWMLDPTREFPAEMPEPLRGHARSIDQTDPAAWSGFVHLGA